MRKSSFSEPGESVRVDHGQVADDCQVKAPSSHRRAIEACIHTRSLARTRTPLYVRLCVAVRTPDTTAVMAIISSRVIILLFDLFSLNTIWGHGGQGVVVNG
mmetsp:Transcript_9875/g.26956  ORF Transcript_9875/g.26956 Transcript_9875/m.26956 type:complete len:102 (-) Transcript_9875:1040-1345(-)